MELLYNCSPDNSSCSSTPWGTISLGWPYNCLQQNTKIFSQNISRWNEWKKPWRVSPLQSPAGCREQVGDQPGHLSQGAFCIHWHRRAGLPHHRRGQHSQRWCTNTPWCESRDFVTFICLFLLIIPLKVIHSDFCTKLIRPVSALSLSIQSDILLILSVHRESFLFPVYSLRASVCLLSLLLPLPFSFPLSVNICIYVLSVIY